MPPGIPADAELRTALMALLLSARRVLGLRVVFRDYFNLAGLDDTLRWRLDDACATVKRQPGCLAGCLAFCARQVVREISLNPQGRVHTCPYGHTEAVMPVILSGQCYGQLIAGPWWCGPGPPPRPGLIAADATRCADVAVVLGALALNCGELLARHLVRRGQDRRRRIAELVAEHHGRDLSLTDLAAELGLSASRCGHLVRELTGRTFPALLREVRLNHAARLLASGDEKVRRIAHQVGFADAGYFSRVFRRSFGMTPQAFRVRHAPTALGS